MLTSKYRLSYVYNFLRDAKPKKPTELSSYSFPATTQISSLLSVGRGFVEGQSSVCCSHSLHLPLIHFPHPWALNAIEPSCVSFVSCLKLHNLTTTSLWSSPPASCPSRSACCSLNMSCRLKISMSTPVSLCLEYPVPASLPRKCWLKLSYRLTPVPIHTRGSNFFLPRIPV